MHLDEKIKWSGVVAGTTAVIGCVTLPLLAPKVIGFVYYGYVSKVIEPWQVAGAGCLLAVGALCIHYWLSGRWHSFAWLLLGLAASTTMIGSFTKRPPVTELWPQETFFHFAWYPAILVLILFVAAGLHGYWSWLARQLVESEVGTSKLAVEAARADERRSKAAAEKESNAARQSRLADKDAAERREREQRNWQAQITVAETARAEAEKREAEGQAYRLYESQLVGALILQIGFSWLRYSSRSPLGVDFHQGNLDYELADLLVQNDRRCWMIELKRGLPELGAERRKQARKDQYQALKQILAREEMAIAQRCHWIGWGHESDREVVIKVARYWPMVGASDVDQRLEMHQARAAKAFVRDAFAPDPEVAVGVTVAEFKRYVAFLYKNADSAPPDNAGAIFVYESADGLRYAVEPGAQSLMQRAVKVCPEIRRRIDPPEHGFSLSR